MGLEGWEWQISGLLAAMAPEDTIWEDSCFPVQNVRWQGEQGTSFFTEPRGSCAWHCLQEYPDPELLG